MDYRLLYIVAIAQVLASIELFSLGAKLVRAHAFPRVGLNRIVVVITAVAVLIIVDFLSSYFFILICVQVVCSALAFCLGVATYMIFPKLKPPNGAFLAKLLKILNSPFLPW